MPVVSSSLACKSSVAGGRKYLYLTMYLNIRARNSTPTRTVAPMKVKVYITPDFGAPPELVGGDGDGDAVELANTALA
jgi:hypothetical protein